MNRSMADAPREPEVLPAAPDATLPVPKPAAAERGVASTDALSAYMAQLAQHAPISREEEQALAERWVADGDVDAARQLVVANLRLVVKIAMEYRRAWVNVLDLIQDGNLGLMEAVQRFDPTKGVKLSTYAAYWIRAYILKYILDNFRIIRLGTTRAQRKLFFQLNKEKRKLEREGYEVTPQLLAERLEVAESEVVDMDLRLSRSDQSMDAPVQHSEGSGAEFGDFIAGKLPSAEDSVADDELRRVFMTRVATFADTLEERDQALLEKRILADEPKTLAEMGELFGVSRERVRQLEKRIVDRLRDYMREELVDFDFYASPKDD